MLDQLADAHGICGAVGSAAPLSDASPVPLEASASLVLGVDVLLGAELGSEVPPLLPQAARASIMARASRTESSLKSFFIVWFPPSLLQRQGKLTLLHTTPLKCKDLVY